MEKNWTDKYWRLKFKYSCVTAETNKAEKQPRPPKKAKPSTVYAQLLFESWRYFNVSEKVNYTKKEICREISFWIQSEVSIKRI